MECVFVRGGGGKEVVVNPDDMTTDLQMKRERPIMSRMRSMAIRCHINVYTCMPNINGPT